MRPLIVRTTLAMAAISTPFLKADGATTVASTTRGLAKSAVKTVPASIVWGDPNGCYSTISYDGQPGSGALKDRGHSKYTPSFEFATMPGVDHIGAFGYLLTKYRQGDTLYSDFVWIFPDYGTSSLSSDGKMKTWSFNGPMVCTGLCPGQPTTFILDTRVEITNLGNDQYKIHNFRQIPAMPDRSMDADDVYVIQQERTNCN